MQNHWELLKKAQLHFIVADSRGRIVCQSDLAVNSLPFPDLAERAEYNLARIPAIHQHYQNCLASGKPRQAIPLSHQGQQWLLDTFPIADQETCFAVLCILRSSLDAQPGSTNETSPATRYLETIFEGSSDGLWVCDGQGKVLRINAASSKLNGVNPEEVVGRNISDLLERKEFDQSVTAKVLASHRQETVMQYISRTKRHLLSTGTPAFDQQGDIDLIVINERDMTELSMLRQQVEEDQKVKEKISQELAELSLLELQRNEIVAESNKMQQLLRMSLKLSNLGASNILILGESGTGKGLLAKFIHRNSRRKKMPIVELNCAALPEHLLEAELFGYEKGAFTGAGSKGKVGLFELADGGTLFLDEIGDMGLNLQAKLLKYLDNQEFRRIGGTKTIKTSCVTIAATNQDLATLVREKKFREDLFYRLNSFPLNIPPLRERPEDIAALIRFFLNEFNNKYQCSKTITAGGMRALQDYTFPGNIRELKNIVENGVVLSEVTNIDAYVRASTGDSPPLPVDESETQPLTFRGNLPGRLAELEKECLLQAQQSCRTTREMAVFLGISQPSVVRKMKLHGLS